MNKIYVEPISKADELVEGIKKQSDLLAKKGIVIDVEKLSVACRELEEAGRIQDEAEAALKVARENAHAKLDALKEIYVASKAPVKQNYASEVWWSFGIPDKK